MTELLKINDAVRICILPASDSVIHAPSSDKAPEGNQPTQHKGRIKNLKGNTVTVALALVLEDEEFLTIHPGVAVVFQKSSEEGLFTCEAVVNSLHAEPSPFVVMTRVSDFTRQQRREYFRIKVDLETRYAQYAHDNLRNGESDRWLAAALRDLSAGGACVTIKGQHQIGEELVLELPLDRGTLCMKGAVCRCQPKGRGKKILYYEVGIKFMEPTQADQSYIMSFVFAQQRKQARGRLK